MTKTAPTIIAVRPGRAIEAHGTLFAGLQAAFGVEFRPWRENARADGVLAIAEDGRVPALTELAAFGVPALAVVAAGAGAAQPARVNVLAEPAVDRRVRGIDFGRESLGAALEPDAAETVLAAAADGAAWTHTHDVHRVRAALPALRRGDVLRNGMVPEVGLSVLALVHFLRALGRDKRFAPPPLRATIIFDDPNLRWRSYGFIDYRALLAHADEHGYHAAMAMIPLDAGRPHGPTAELFSQRRDRLSLVVHGNDHVKRELMTPTHELGALSLAAQAMRRVCEFERRYGVLVDRVMTPPHGVASEHMTVALGQAGFDALCTLHALPWTERPRGDLPLAGWGPGEFVGDCAVIPRFALDSSAEHIALRAFLDQPIVLYGHHDDVRGGLDPIAEAVERVNRVGDVMWTSTGEIALTNYALRVEGEEAIVRPYSRRLRLAVPAGVTRLRLERPSDSLSGPGLSGWSAQGGEPAPIAACLEVEGARELELRLHGHGDVEPAGVGAPPWNPWPQVRRIATEARDRVLPLRRAV